MNWDENFHNQRRQMWLVGVDESVKETFCIVGWFVV